MQMYPYHLDKPSKPGSGQSNAKSVQSLTAKEKESKISKGFHEYKLRPRRKPNILDKDISSEEESESENSEESESDSNNSESESAIIDKRKTPQKFVPRRQNSKKTKTGKKPENLAEKNQPNSRGIKGRKQTPKSPDTETEKKNTNNTKAVPEPFPRRTAIRKRRLKVIEEKEKEAQKRIF